tara:strand:+ start:832 stop:1308 length:477 start_codon:yes stop_codon:yes gene_type:complete
MITDLTQLLAKEIANKIKAVIKNQSAHRFADPSHTYIINVNPYVTIKEKNDMFTLNNKGDAIGFIKESTKLINNNLGYYLHNLPNVLWVLCDQMDYVANFEIKSKRLGELGFRKGTTNKRIGVKKLEKKLSEDGIQTLKLIDQKELYIKITFRIIKNE